MKNFKYVLIFLTCISFAQNISAMEAGNADTKEVKVADPEAKKASFSLESINKRLESIVINKGYFHIKEDHAAYAKELRLSTPLSIPRQLKLFFIKSGTETVVGFRKYLIDARNKLVEAKLVMVNKECQKHKLGTLLILATLHDPEVSRLNCTKTTVIAFSSASQGLYTKLGFDRKTTQSFELNDLQTFLNTKTHKLVEEVFEKLETIAKFYAGIA